LLFYLIGSSRAAARPGRRRSSRGAGGQRWNRRQAAVHSFALWAASLPTGGRGMIRQEALVTDRGASKKQKNLTDPLRACCCRSTQRRLDGSFQGTTAIRSGQIDRHVVGQTCRSRRRDNGHSVMTARTNRTGAIDKGCAMSALSRMHVSAPVSQRAGVAHASMEET
jgi:hypothetical protein